MRLCLTAYIMIKLFWIQSAKFKELKNDVTKKKEKKLQRLFRSLKKNNILHQLIYENIYSTGSAPAKICGLPKMHKCGALRDLVPCEQF